MLLVHPDQSDQVVAMVDRHCEAIREAGGKIHRREDLGRKALAYPIKKLHKAHYVLLNVECSKHTLEERVKAFRLNDFILRQLVLSMDEAVTEPSALMREKNERAHREARGDYQHQGNYQGGYGENDRMDEQPLDEDEEGEEEEIEVEAEENEEAGS